MQTKNRLLDELARLLNGAAGVASSVRDEAGAQLRSRLERMFAGLDLVPRDEFEAVKEMAARARSGQQKLEKRVEKLEGRRAAVKRPAARRKARAKAKRKLSSRK